MNRIARVFSVTAVGIGTVNLSNDNGLQLIIMGVIVFVLSFIKPGGGYVS